MIHFLTEQERIDLMNESREALRKLRNSDSITKNTLSLKVIEEGLQKFDISSSLFEAFDLSAWETKVKIDVLYFEQLFQKLNDDQIRLVEESLGVYFKNIRLIYEFVNLKPEIYGRGIDVHILEDSNEVCQQKLSKVIFEYLDNYFYKLTPEARVEKYLETSRELSKTLISEGIDSEEAIQFSIKTSVMENLLTRIAFPFATWTRIQSLMESEDYGKVFDQKKLIELVESFQKKVGAIARIVASVV